MSRLTTLAVCEGCGVVLQPCFGDNIRTCKSFPQCKSFPRSMRACRNGDASQAIWDLERELNAANDQIKQLIKSGDKLASVTPRNGNSHEDWEKAKAAK